MQTMLQGAEKAQKVPTAPSPAGLAGALRVAWAFGGGSASAVGCEVAGPLRGMLRQGDRDVVQALRDARDQEQKVPCAGVLWMGMYLAKGPEVSALCVRRTTRGGLRGAEVEGPVHGLLPGGHRGQDVRRVHRRAGLPCEVRSFCCRVEMEPVWREPRHDQRGGRQGRATGTGWWCSSEVGVCGLWRSRGFCEDCFKVLCGRCRKAPRKNKKSPPLDLSPSSLELCQASRRRWLRKMEMAVHAERCVRSRGLCVECYDKEFGTWCKNCGKHPMKNKRSREQECWAHSAGLLSVLFQEPEVAVC